MAPSDRRKPGEGEPKQPTQSHAPSELSSRGKVVIRSSSHPPGSDSPITDPPPIDEAVVGDAQRAKKTTPAERPRKRRKVQAEQLAREQAVARGESRQAASEARDVAASSENARLRWLLVAIALGLAALYWFAR